MQNSKVSLRTRQLFVVVQLPINQNDLVNIEGGSLWSKYGCEGELVKIDCDNSRVIEVVRANYGRLSNKICTNSQSSYSPSSLTECLHRSSKSVLDRVCGGKSSCTVRASEGVFQTQDCPLVEKYLEVHFRCVSVRGAGGGRRDLLPPWLEDLSATFRPVSRPPSTSTTTSTTISTSTQTISDDIEADDDHQNIVISESPMSVENVTQSGGKKGRYFLIPETGQEAEREEESAHTTIIITVTISTVSTILSILILIHICRKFRGKSVRCEEPAEESCYQCHLPERQMGDLNVIPVQVTAEVANLLMHKQ